MDRQRTKLLLLLAVIASILSARILLGLDPATLLSLTMPEALNGWAWRGFALLLIGLLGAGLTAWGWHRVLAARELNHILAGAGLIWIAGLGSALAGVFLAPSSLSWLPFAGANAACLSVSGQVRLFPSPASAFLLLSAAGIAAYLASTCSRSMGLGLGALIGGTAGLWGVAAQSLSVLSPIACAAGGYALPVWAPGLADVLAAVGLVLLLAGILYLGIAWQARQSRPWFERPADLTNLLATGLLKDGDPLDCAAATMLQGSAAEAHSDIPTAEAAYAQALALYRSLSNANGELVALTRLAVLAAKTGRPAEARAWSEQAAKVSGADLPDVVAELAMNMPV